SLKAVAALLFLIGVLLLWRNRPPRKELVNAMVLGILIFGYAFQARWNRLLLNSGQNVVFGRTDKTASASAKPDPDPVTKVHLVFFEEHPQGGFTTVVQLDHAKSQPRHMLLTNGKFEGVDDLQEQGYAQISFAAIPSQFTPGFGRALQIGLGTGQSAYALERMGFRQVEIAEYAPGVVHAAAQWFQNVNGNVLSAPNVRLYLEDGRNLLLLDRSERFDLISVEITSVWFAGATNLYSREFYELAKSRLKPGGAFQQWLQLHHITPRELTVEIGTLRSVFPYVSLWSSGGQGMLVASGRPQTLTPERRSYMIGHLSSLEGVPEGKQAEVQHQVFDSQLLDSEGVDRLLRTSPHVLNTDHNRWIEYATPRYNWTDNDGAGNFAWIRTFESR
ncbi:MAG TPA: hypothetical protein VFW83_09420, partial [Bryobacteraceae bacterium]|nr:hypothetical protein [Bryobacteraceae bacterium]